MKYILAPGVEIGNTEVNIIHVLTPEEINSYYDLGYNCKERRYKVTVDYREYEIVCTEIWKKGDTEHSVIIPAFLIPHRRYPLDVYVYAINLYCSEPEKGQRAAAKATKKHFGLDKFSHTTISRSMKTMSQILDGGVDTCAQPKADSQMAKQETSQQRDISDGTYRERRFPLLRDIQKRRELIVKYFKDKLDAQSRPGLMESCERIAIWWHTKFNRLLI